MKTKTSSGSGPSQRQLRVGELVRHALSDVLSRGDIPDPALSKVLITVPEVRMSPDLKIATCFVMPLGGKDTKAAIEALATNAKPLRGEIARRLELKFVPELRFRIDTSFEEGARIDALLRSPEVARDVARDLDHDLDHDDKNENDKDDQP